MNQIGLFDQDARIAELELENAELRNRIAYLERQVEGKWRSPGKTGNSHPEHARDRYRRDTAKHLVIRCIRDAGPMNNSELFEAIGGGAGLQTPNAVASRTGELVDMNHLEVVTSDGGVVTRPTASGGQGQLYRLTNDGKRFLLELESKS